MMTIVVSNVAIWSEQIMTKGEKRDIANKNSAESLRINLRIWGW